MIIQGIQKLTLLDYPGKLATTVFLGGCNFRCPFCHNASLVLSPSSKGCMSEDELFEFLESRKGKIAAVCISGGEPTLYSDLPLFISKIKEMGFLVKLDTNGSNTEMIYSLLSDELIDYVAMDIKSSKDGYDEATGGEVDLDAIEQSVMLLLNSDIEYEFRTTVVRELHTAEHIRDIAEWIRGAKRYYLQTYKDSGDILGGSEFTAYSKDEMTRLLDLVRPYVQTCGVRG